MENTLVSVIIPLYNGSRYLAEAIESVLAQTYQPVEIIVVDDGSTDNSAEVAKRFAPSVRYHFQENGGTGAARNCGINLARGAYFAFLDQDDIWLENKLIHQIAAFESDTKLDIVFGQVQQFYSPELNWSMNNKIRCSPEIVPGCIPSATIVKRDAFFQVGWFKTEWQLGTWADWYARARELELRSKMLPELVTRRRLHATNQGISQSYAIKEFARVLKASLDRRRANNRD